MVPHNMTSHVHAFDVQEGGLFRISLTYDTPSGTGKTTAHSDTYHGRFVTLVPNERVVEVMEFETADPAMRGEMSRGRFDPARYDQIVPILQEIATTMSGLPGFHKYHVGVDGAAGRIAAVTDRDTRAHGEFSRAVLGDSMHRLQALGVELEPAEVYDLVVEA